MEDKSFKLRDYQENIVEQAKSILREKGLVYLAMEVRTGKTFCALFTCEGATDVLFVTKKKAIPSIRNDFETSGLTYNLEIVNYESLHKIPQEGWSVVIVDESHSLGAFPKPSKRAKDLKALVSKSKCPTLHLSGTPTPESYSQIFHQLWINPNSPFANYKSFYKWAGQDVKPNHVNVKKKRIGLNMIVNDYSDAIATKIKPIIKPFMIHYSQADAGFTSVIKEEILKVKMNDTTYDIAHRLTKDLVVVGKEQTLIADTPVKLQSKLHQLYSGTIKFEDGTRKILDLSKAQYIRDNFGQQKLAIFYKFTAEYMALKEVFGELLCDSIDTFDTTDKHIALQIQSGREGTKLSNADALLFYNIDFSATSYWQGRDRMTTMDRKFNKVYWIFSEGGIEEKIYDMVSKKKSYTSYYFRRDFGIKDSKRFKQIKLGL